jgi:hypothetical protein
MHDKSWLKFSFKGINFEMIEINEINEKKTYIYRKSYEKQDISYNK